MWPALAVCFDGGCVNQDRDDEENKYNHCLANCLLRRYTITMTLPQSPHSSPHAQLQSEAVSCKRRSISL